MPLEFEVIPELALRNEAAEFLLGMPLCQAIAVIQRLSRQVKNVELIYCQQDPLSRDILINLSADGVRLLFDSQWQRLKLIEVYDLRNIVLRYGSAQFSSPSDRATVAKVEQCFGATHPGVYDKQQRIYVLNWRGLSFWFPLESAVQPGYAHGLSSLQIPGGNGSSPTVSKMSVYCGPNISEAIIPELPLPCYAGNCQMNNVRVLCSNEATINGIELEFLAEVAKSGRSTDVRSEKLQCRICFGDTEEDVLSYLGSPSRVFYKSEDKMRIHRPSGSRNRGSRLVDYFFNYFTLGLDMLFDGETRTVRKFVLHTNYPGHFDFGIYYRCNFELRLEERPCDFAAAASLTKKTKTRTLTVTPFTKWDEISSCMYDADSQLQVQPVVLNRTSSTGAENPFGATFCYGYKDMIVEVMANGHIASVTLFAENQ